MREEKSSVITQLVCCIVAIFVAIIIAVTALFSTIKTYSIYDVSNLRKEKPSYIIVHFDDPSVAPKFIEDAETISTILSYYNARTYQSSKSSHPMPKSNAYVTIVYSDGAEVSLPIGDFTRYKVITSDDLGSFIELLK